ncbi:MAG TPA: ABC transporter substrate-binding protein [Kaistiaceae bacterium]|nr:ABC transporter substrate-binding protein [Kaistiaceae bacterium]
MLFGLCASAVAPGLVAAPAPARAEPAFSRIVSLNVCADQFLIAFGLADRVVAFGPIVRDPVLSFYADRAGGLPTTAASAESVLLLRPDIVLAGPFAGLLAKRVLRAEGVRIEEIGIPQTIAEARRQILDLAAFFGVPERGAAIVAELDAVLAAVPDGPRPRALYLQRRLFATGEGTLVDDLLAHTGFDNALSGTAPPGISRFSLESLAGIPADVLVLDGRGGGDGDQGAAVLLHPLVERLYPADRRIVLPLSSIVCAGPPLVEAVKTLVAARQRLGSTVGTRP